MLNALSCASPSIQIYFYGRKLSLEFSRNHQDVSKRLDQELQPEYQSPQPPTGDPFGRQFELSSEGEEKDLASFVDAIQSQENGEIQTWSSGKSQERRKIVLTSVSLFIRPLLLKDSVNIFFFVYRYICLCKKTL